MARKLAHCCARRLHCHESPASPTARTNPGGMRPKKCYFAMPTEDRSDCVMDLDIYTSVKPRHLKNPEP